MKKCKFCQTEIDSKAKICPNCNKKQGISKWIIILIVIIGVVLFGSLTDSDNSTENKTNTTTTETLSLLEGHSGSVDSNYTYKISGTIKNNKNTDYSYVQVEFYAYDSNGNLLDTCIDNNSGLEANGTWKFEASCFFANENAKDVASYKLKEITKW